MLRSRSRWFAALLLLPLLCALPRIHAQNVYATIHGTVTDVSGAVIPNAKVTALNTSTGIATNGTTDGKGYYTFPQLQTGGPYTVSVVASGFQRYEKTGITLRVNDNPEIDAALQVGSNTQTVQVAASAVQVQTSDTQIKTDITSREVEQMPLLGRDASILEKTAPGVVEVPDRFGNPESDGAQSQQNEFTLDGVDVNDVALQDQAMYPNPDALAEVAVVQNDLNPEYSRNSGAVISETLKSGTNSFHGDGFEFYRDTFLNSAGWGTVSGRPEFHQNVYGGTLGGPIVRNKWFFFAAYQGFKNRTGAPSPATVFSPAQDAGIFSADKNQATQAANSAGLSANPMPFAVDGCAAGTAWNACPAFKGGTINIPTSAWNAEAAALVATYVPPANETETNPNTGFTSYIDNFNTANSAKQDQGIIRTDYHPTQNDTLWASSIFQSSPDVQQLPFGGANLPGFTEVNAAHIKVFNADYTHTFNSTTLNDFRGGYFRFNYAAVTPQTITPPGSAGFNITPQDSEEGLPNMGLTGYFTLGFSSEGPQPRKDTNLLGSDTVTKILGNHSLKFGALYEQFGVENPYYADNNGGYSYGGVGSYSSGDPAIDFVLGIPDTYAQASGSIIDAISHEYYVFAQD
ncbi:MAG: carboxypeptidase-like regulatory domain-containing protein, partial [Acidobacteriaceae bacterium]